ncbi:MAG: lipopolysaccharide heptosyltransferase I [Candidatus Accumulibacter sp.]|uniref:lipopolysaccharide heptosyltransferase I n=1 Tax=Accumulibacter sp. TaxID=2053492 RepID=UPI00287ABAD1|nr:lipopolysaccharide heptosyltransferase I [Accumulibacter sp.]MDS4015904.1 lipopolysaccharide heptosyltransferase I [Accumulibacter sp.]
MRAMRILLVKTSSLGDVIHNLPVAADIARHLPGAEIDWCVEASFADIPRLSPHVRRVIPVAVRRWRKALLAVATWREIGGMRQALGAHPYDAILDTQGLLKSALIARQATGPRLGYAADSAREPLAARLYDRHFSVDKSLHAVVRNRQLAGAALGYLPGSTIDYGIASPEFVADWLPETPTAVLLTATSRDDKLWPEHDWIAVARELVSRGLTPVLPGGNTTERDRAARITAAVPGAIAAPALGIRELAGIIGRSKLAIGVDTGLAHLATALTVPTVALYTATDPALTGVLGSGFFRNLGGIGKAPTVTEVLASTDEALET